MCKNVTKMTMRDKLSTYKKLTATYSFRNSNLCKRGKKRKLQFEIIINNKIKKKSVLNSSEPARRGANKSVCCPRENLRSQVILDELKLTYFKLIILRMHSKYRLFVLWWRYVAFWGILYGIH